MRTVFIYIYIYIPSIYNRYICIHTHIVYIHIQPEFYFIFILFYEFYVWSELYLMQTLHLSII